MTSSTDSSQTLSRATLAQWLANLGNLSVTHAAHHLSQLLKQLKNLDDSDPALQLHLLLGLTPATIRISHNLHTLVSQEGQDEKTRKFSRLCMQLPRQLGLNFALLAESGRLDGSQSQLAMYHALQAIGHASLYYALAYEEPSETLWKRSAALYKLARPYRYRQHDLGDLITEYQGQTTIEAVVKRNLLFALLQPTLFDTDRVKTLFQFSNRHANNLNFSEPTHTATALFAWDLNGAQPPIVIKHTRKTLPDDYLGIDTSRIGQALIDNTIGQDINVDFRSRLRHHLTGYSEVFASIIPVKPQSTDFVQGFDDVCAYLLQQDKVMRIMQVGGQDANPLLVRRKIALMPMENERHAFHTAAEKSKASVRMLGRRVHKMRIESDRYVLIEGYAFDCNTGEITLVCDDDKPPVLAIVRQQTYHDLTGAMHILLEKIPGTCGIYGISPKTDNRKAIVLNENTPCAEVFLRVGRYDRQCRIPLLNDKAIVLTDFLETTDSFARYRFNFDS